MAKTLLEFNIENDNDTEARGNIHNSAMMIVSMWGHRKFGQNRRLYNESLSKSEQARLADLYHKRLYDWCLRTGLPQKLRIHTETVLLIEKAANVFAEMR